MKRVVYFAFILIAVSCNNEVMEFEGYKESETTIQSKTRSINEAIEIANNAAQEFFGITRAGGGRIVDVNNVDIITSSLTRSSGNNDTLLYIVNYEDNNGFAVISASRNADALLAVTEQGSYNPDSENVGFNMFMDMAEIYSARTILPPGVEEGATLLPIKEYKETLDTIENTHILPKIKVQWGQRGIESKYADNSNTKAAGCANVATAQVMSYFSYPTQIELTYLGNNSYIQPLNWDAIKLHQVRHENNSNCTAHEAISQLHRQLGHLNNSCYEPSVTSTADSDIKKPFNKFGYSVLQYMNYNNSDFASLLKQNKIVVLLGMNEDLNAGHVWVVDGLKKISILYTAWTRDLGSTYWEELSQSTSTIEYYHHNWGLDGNCNGYFNKNVFDPNNSISYDNEGAGYQNSLSTAFGYNVKYFWVTR